MTETTTPPHPDARSGVRTEARSDGRADAGRADPGRADPGRRHGVDPLFQVRTADIEPYTGLRYLSKLFRMIAIVLVLLLIAEVATGLWQQGSEAISTLLAEVSRLIVLAGLLWGVGDLAILLIDVGHDVRAARILIGRQTSHLVHEHQGAPLGHGAPAGDLSVLPGAATTVTTTDVPVTGDALHAREVP